MEELGIPAPIPTIERFRSLAEEGNWDKYDRLARSAANNESFISWTAVGLSSDNPHDRDLAITLLENTTLPSFEDQRKNLIERRDSEKDSHLQGKIAIALFRYGDKSSETLGILQEAYTNDEELREQVGTLLGIAEKKL